MGVACGGGGQTTEAANSSDTSVADTADTAGTGTATGGGATGGGATSGKAVAAPLDVPDIGGRGVDDVLEDAKRKFRAVCGGDVCVKLVVVHPPRDPAAEERDCSEVFVGTSPPKGSSIDRESTVKLLFRYDPSCAGHDDEPTTIKPPPTTSKPTPTTTGTTVKRPSATTAP